MFRALCMLGLLALGCRTDDPPGRDTGLAVPDTAVPARPPNLLVLLTDDQGVDMVSGWGVGADPPATPSMDGLIDAGVRFTAAWAAPTCSPTRAALLTGRHGRRTGIGSVIFDSTSTQLSLQERTFAEALRDAPVPYATAAIGKWHLASPASVDGVDHPNLQGFDHFAGTLGNLGGNGGYEDWTRVEDGVSSAVGAYATSVAVDDALDRISSLPEPWVVYVAFHAPHSPWTVPPDALNPRGAVREDGAYEVYRAMVEALDLEVGRLLDGLGDQRANTVIALLSDNGTPHEVTDPTIAGKNTPNEAGIRVPMVVAGPGVAAGADCDVPVHVVDLLPTLLELAGSAPSPGWVLDGISLVPWLVEPTAPATRGLLYTEKFIPNGDAPRTIDWRIVRDDRFKYWVKVGLSEQPAEALVDLWADAETNLLAADPIATEHAAARDRLAAELDTLFATLSAP